MSLAAVAENCIMRGQRAGIPYWHIVRVSRLKKPLLSKVTTPFSVTDYGEILASGWGEVVPAELREKYQLPAA